MIIVLVVFAIFAATLFIVSGCFKDHVQTFTLKALASFAFIVLFAGVLYTKFANVGSTHYLAGGFVAYGSLAMCFLVALVSGFVGDAVLELRALCPKEEHEHIIMTGIVAFFTGHIFYYIMLIDYGRFSIYPLLFSVVITAVVFLASKLMRLDWQRMLWPSVGYSLLIFLMIGQAFANAINTDFGLFSLIIFIGGVLFGISDLLLSQIYFKEKTPQFFRVLNLSTYYAAQILLALALLFIV